MAIMDVDSSDTKSEISVDSAGEDSKFKSKMLEKSRSRDDPEDKKKKRRVSTIQCATFCILYIIYILTYNIT